MLNSAYFLAGIFRGAILLPILYFLTGGRLPEAVTKLGRSHVPKVPHELDFSRRFDISTTLLDDNATVRVFQDVQVVGYVRGPLDQTWRFANEWIVAERADGRKAFFSASQIRSMEESAVADDQPSS